ncbi:integrase [Vibrio cholerae]|nr:integrase [Vibrio cholerae]
MKIELVTHETGEQIPMMLDDSGMPVVLPNEFILARRSLSTNTLVCSGQLKLATVLEFSQYNRSDSLGVKPPLY